MAMFGTPVRVRPLGLCDHAKVMSFIPAEFYFRLRLNGHTSWPVFRSTALPTFPRAQGSDAGNKQ